MMVRFGRRGQYAVELLRLCIIIGLLMASVTVAHDVLGLAAGISIFAGGAIVYVISVTGLRRLLPDRRLPITDDYRVEQAPHVTARTPKRRTDRGRALSPLSVVFRAGMFALGILTVLDVSHTIRLILAGGLLVIVGGECLRSLRRKRAQHVQQ